MSGNPWTRTGIFLGSAVGLVALALVTRPGAREPEFFREEGSLFFPGFTEPGQAAKLEVTALDKTGTIIKPFAVEKKDGRWTIPSHYGYPADAEERMGKAAGLFIGLAKKGVRSDNASDHARFGVVDPSDESLDSTGRGQKVIFRDTAGNELAALILGNKVREEGGGEQGLRFVREPGKKRVYTAAIPSELSTAFGDWIEKDLLKVQSYDVEKLVFDNHSVDETQMILVPGEKLEFAKKDYKWTLSDLQPGEEMKEDKVRDAGAELDRIQIVGVRQKPEGITAELKTARGFEAQAIADWLARRGFYAVKGGDLKSDEGELIAVTNKGVKYTLRFGQVVYGDEESLSAGSEDEGAKKEGEEKKEGVKPNRYLLVSVEFDPTGIAKPTEPKPAEDLVKKRESSRDAIQQVSDALAKYRDAHESKFPKALQELTTDAAAGLKELPKDAWGKELSYTYDEATNTYVLAALGADGAIGGDGENSDIDSKALEQVGTFRKLYDDWVAAEKKEEEGKKEVAKLAKRFEPWYYVIDAASFDKLRVKRADVVKAPEAGPPVPPGGESGGTPPPLPGGGDE
ncbi:MAG: DUF4340 domain-containing protein [Planctomycetes bacterium]|nr:DUF4340 domain-containing protein [Planctomycetota bacterium]